MMKNTVLTIADGLVAFRRGSLEFVRPPSWEEWGQVMVFVSATRQTSLRWLADVRAAGRREFGDEAVVGFEVQLDLDLPDLKAARALECLEGRQEGLTDEHAWLVASRVEDPVKQQFWLDTAREKSLSPGDLAASISADRVVRKSDEPRRQGGMASIEGVSGLFAAWQKQVPDVVWQVWPREKQAALREQIKEIGAMWDWLNVSLGENRPAALREQISEFVDRWERQGQDRGGSEE